MLSFLMVAVVVNCFLSSTEAIDLIKYEEGPEIVAPMTSVDLNWLFSVKQWNFVAGSKYGFFRFAKGFKSLAALEEKDLHEKCMRTTLSETKVVTLHGFGQHVEYVMAIGDKPAIINWRIKDAPEEKDQSVGITYITLTDNKTYFASIQNWDLKKRAWLVMSTEKVLSPQLKAKILEHILPLGFSEELAFYKDFNTCPPKDD